MKNLHDLKTFQSMKKTSALSGNEKVYESVNKIDDNWAVEDSILIPVSLVNAYVTKVKNESGQNLRDRLSDQRIAEELVKYLVNNYINIENFPASIVLGDEFTKGAQVEPQMQPQMQPQSQPQSQPQMQPQGQPEEIQSQEIQTPQGQAEATAQEIPAQEGGGQGQEIQTQATQSQV